MTLDDEIRAVEGVVDAARRAVSEHLERASKDLHLVSSALARYEDFLGTAVLNAETALSHCRELAAAPAVSVETAERVAAGILAGARESLRSMYLAMTVVEQLAGPTHRGDVTADAMGPRACSFCGRTEAETRIVAGPGVGICAPCTRLAGEALGMSPSR